MEQLPTPFCSSQILSIFVLFTLSLNLPLYYYLFSNRWDSFINWATVLPAKERGKHQVDAVRCSCPTKSEPTQWGLFNSACGALRHTDLLQCADLLQRGIHPWSTSLEFKESKCLSLYAWTIAYVFLSDHVKTQTTKKEEKLHKK